METKNLSAKADRAGLFLETLTRQKNPDGSYDLYFGPEAPKGQENNCAMREDYFVALTLPTNLENIL